MIAPNAGIEPTTENVLNGCNRYTPVAPKQALGKGWHELYL